MLYDLSKVTNSGSFLLEKSLLRSSDLWLHSCLMWSLIRCATHKIIVQSYKRDMLCNLLFNMCVRQVALLLQRDRARHMSLEILQLQNISLENPIVWHYLCDSTFSLFDTIPECDRHTYTECMQTDRHTTTAYTALSIASRGKNRPYCTANQL